MRAWFIGLFLALFALTSCSTHLVGQKEPLTFIPSETDRAALTSYPEESAPLNQATDWGKELFIGREFAKEGDWYRALTAFRRARFFLSLEKQETPQLKALQARLTWSECLIYAYSGKWSDVVKTWEKYKDTLLIPTIKLQEQWATLLYAAYIYTEKNQEAALLLQLLAHNKPLQTSLLEWHRLCQYDPTKELPKTAVEQDLLQKIKSPDKARWYNACFPGLGYWYIGQKQTACTSFLLNASFIGAAVQLITIHQPFLALITASFEAGWYFGGIAGAGIEAHLYNQRMREKVLVPYFYTNKIFPLLKIEVGW